MELKNKYTRKIDREYQKILLTNSKTSTDSLGSMDIQIEPFQAQVANDYLVMQLFGLSQKEVDEMSMQEYDECYKKAMEAKNFLSLEVS